MSTDKGVVVGVERLTRACGCVFEFRLFEPDPFQADRRAKFLLKRCEICGRKPSDAEQDEASQPDLPMRMLPRGTRITVERTAAGGWAGELTLGKVRVQSRSGTAIGLVQKLAHEFAKAVRTP